MFSNGMKWVAAVMLCASGFLATNAMAANREILSFRLPQWKSVHLDDAKAAKVSVETLKQIGCEAEQHQHGGHFDVRYRCIQWRSIALNTHDEAHQWERWLKSFGFETAHQH